MSNLVDNNLFEEVKSVLELAKSRAYTAVNFAMVEAYWEIGRLIVKKQGGEERAEYGSNIIRDLSARLTVEYGKGYTATNLKYMRQFYQQFQNHHTLCDKLSWSHYRLIMRVENENARQFYTDECARSNWSVRQLDRQINSFFYERLLSSRGAEAKKAVSAEIHTKEAGVSPLDIIKDPYVLEFLGLNHNEHHFESDLEKALITHIQKFL